MLRYIAIVAALLASPCFAQDMQTEPARNAVSVSRDGFVFSGDACGASRYASLVGQSLKLSRTSLPANAVIHNATHGGAVNIADMDQRPAGLSTLEYRPHQLNVVVDSASRILAIGCY